MRTLILSLAIAGAIASPLALAQSRGGGGGPPPGAGGGMGGPPMGMPSGNIGHGMGGSMGIDMRNSMGSLHAQERSDRAALRRENAQTPEQAMFGLFTADRAKLLKNADVDTRKAFGAYQASLAKAKNDDSTTAIANAETTSRADIQAFGADTAARASELKDADRRTRKAFGKFQSALARQQLLERVAGTTSVQAAFGIDTAASAKLQADADPAARTQFGANQAVRAKAQVKSSSGTRRN